MSITHVRPVLTHSMVDLPSEALCIQTIAADYSVYCYTNHCPRHQPTMYAAVAAQHKQPHP